MWKGKIRKVGPDTWVIEKDYKECMRVPAYVYASDKLLEGIKSDNTLEQSANVACLPGIQLYSITLPDGHYGYGFPIGGVAATDATDGVISPGGVGFDINCGCRILRSNLNIKDVLPKIKEIVDSLYVNIPSGVGSKGKIRISTRELNKVFENGAAWAVDNGYGYAHDLERLEEDGAMEEADSSKVSETAKKRGAPQLGTLGSGNHFIEVQVVDRIFDEEVAKIFGLEKDMVTIMIHTGSRGAGHQICSDYLRTMENAVRKYNIKLPDRQLACAPVDSKEAQDYFKAMACAANYAWANRQCITHWARESLRKIFNMSDEDLGLEIVYDVAHNIAKLEEHVVEGEKRKVYVHRKGATRAFGPGHKDVSPHYRKVGQPVLIPGDMGTASYVLVGTEEAMKKTFGSTCHGAGRELSRSAAKKRYRADTIVQELGRKGIYIRAASKAVVAEEAPGAYKEVDEVVRVSHNTRISTMVARMVPLGVAKG
ncbi:MAG: RtcB family protein [Candidatus Hydrothermarchaeota archaeon]